MRLFLWDVKYKTWNTKKAQFNVTLCEFHQGSFGLGFDWYFTKGPVLTRYGRYACLTVRFMWAEVMFSANWGPGKARMDELYKRRKLTPPA